MTSPVLRMALLTALTATCVAPRASAAATTTTTSTDTTTTHHAKGKTTSSGTKTTKTTQSGKTTTTTTHTTRTSGHAGGTTRTTETSRTKTTKAAATPHHPPHRPVAKATPPAPAPAPVAAAIPPPPPATPAKGSESGLPLPRFVALRSDQVSFRAGPGTRYPIDWVYQRRYLPVKVEREFEVWRLVSEPDGTKGWVHQAMLTGRRGLIITGTEPQTIRAAAISSAAAVAIVKPGVVGRLLSCAAAAQWCKVQVKTVQGWLPRTAFWGALPDETISQ